MIVGRTGLSSWFHVTGIHYYRRCKYSLSMVVCLFGALLHRLLSLDLSGLRGLSSPKGIRMFGYPEMNKR